MKKKAKKRKKIIFFFLGLIILSILGYFLVVFLNEKSIKFNDMYIAGTSPEITLYDLEFKEVDNIIRGTKVKVLEQDVTSEKGEEKYTKIEYQNKEYLVRKEALVDKIEDVVLEKTLYVRTPLTIYKDAESGKILSMAKKGSELEILGFDKLDENGKVNLYKIKHNDSIGYAYSKYMVSTKEEALKNYDEDGIYKIHTKRTDTQGGGSATNLDFYPVEKPIFENNVMPKEVRALYLNTTVVSRVDEYIKIAKNNNINAFVVDIKDSGPTGYPSSVMKEKSPTNYKKAYNSYETYKNAIKKLKDEGFYVIGRISVFKDYNYVQDHPEDAILDAATGQPFKHNSSYWPSAYSRAVWEFNVELAKEAVREMGFNEIQFDYVRFPDRTYSLEKNGKIDMRNTYNEEKAQAIQGFLMYACDEIHKEGVYVSADVFGEAAHTYVTGYGQYWGAISNVVDVISAMPYPDHFNAYEYGFKEVVWTVPYELLKFWGTNYVVKRQSEIPTPAIVRTWIQTYDTIRAPYITYDASKIEEQIRGLYNAGLDGGFMTWNAGSSLEKYKAVAPAFKKDY